MNLTNCGGYSAEDYLNDVALPHVLVEAGVKLTVVEIEDVGVFGSDGKPLVHQDVFFDPTRVEREALGLPSAFGSSKKIFRTKRRSEKDGKGKNGGQSGNSDGAVLRISMKRSLLKYWLQRFSLFSRFDEGIEIDEEGWYSTTPECLAKHHAKKCKELIDDHHIEAPLIIIDAFCGVGGNTIQFAAQGNFVLAIDISIDRIVKAKHNCKIYKVDHHVECIHGDFYQLGYHLQPNVVFLSPPWGGPEYLHQPTIRLSLESKLGCYVASSLELCAVLKEKMGFLMLLLYLPRNVDLVSFMQINFFGFRVSEVEIMKVNGLMKALTIYLM